MPKECLHKFHSVYHGSEWVVECEKCSKDVFDLYNKEDANKIVDNLLIVKKNQKYNFYNTGTPQEMIEEENYFNPKNDKEKKDEILSICILILAIIIFCLLL
jgi:hypothetical protein